MPFPIDTSTISRDEQGLFLVQNVNLRSRVLPLFGFELGRQEVRPLGHGTAFRIDPWSRCVTAYHVIEDFIEVNAEDGRVSLKSNPQLAALEFEALAYGRVPIPENSWRPLSDALSICKIEQQPLEATQLRNFTELMALRIQPSTLNDLGTPYLPIDLRSWEPQTGESVMALGFANLDRPSEGDNGTNRPMSQYLYGSIGEITDIVSADTTRTRPWPMIRIKVNLPGGMSGGPVFNETGHVVGVISAGFEGVDSATAVIFSGWDIPERIFSSIDPNNAGWFRCWGAFDTNGELVICEQDKTKIEQFRKHHNLADVGRISFNPATGDHMRFTG